MYDHSEELKKRSSASFMDEASAREIKRLRDMAARGNVDVVSLLTLSFFLPYVCFVSILYLMGGVLMKE